MSISQIGDILKFIGGLGMFLYGMNTMADGLQKSASGKMKKLLGYITNNRFMGVLFGAVITAIIQSSSATTVMVVGFVNAGILNLVQAVGVIMGANIGTTITAWIVSMSEWGQVMKPEFFAPLLLGIGVVLIMFMKRQKAKDTGGILVGFGLLFIGLSFMSGAIEPYRDAPVFSEAFRVLGRNPFFAIIAGMVVTAVIQSSSASVGILQTLALNGIVNWRSAVFITLGQNIGTCVTALISCAGTHKNAKRAAVIHLMFNVFGAAIFGVIMFVIFRINEVWATSTINTVEISIFHTLFNILNTIILFPFATVLVKLSKKIVPDRNSEEEEESHLAEIQRKLDDRILETPSFAIETVENEVVEMGALVVKSTKKVAKAILEKDENAIKYVLRREEELDQLEVILTNYLVKVDNLSLNEEQHEKIKNLLYTVSDIERIGDHCENLAEIALRRIDMKLHFSEVGYSDLKAIISQVTLGVESAIESREKLDHNAVLRVAQAEDEVDNLESDLREKHIQRLSKKECQTESGIVFLDILSNLERMSDHAYNIAGYVQSEL